MPGIWRSHRPSPQVIYGLAGLGLALLLIGAWLAWFLAFTWPSASKPDNGVLRLRPAEAYAVGRPEFHEDGRFWLIHQADGSFLALSVKDPYLGCTVPWRDSFAFTDPRTGEYTRGWFRNPCHGQTYDLYGYCVAGPCIRGLDRYPARVEDGIVLVDTRRLIEGPPREAMPDRR